MKNMHPYRSLGFLLALLLPAFAQPLCAQGFLQRYSNPLSGRDIYEKSDGYVLIANNAYNTLDESNFYQIKTDVDGQQTGAQGVFQAYPGDFSSFPLENGDHLSVDYTQEDSVMVARRYNAAGALLWETQYGIGESNLAAPIFDHVASPIRITEDPRDGGIFVYNFFESEFDLTYDIIIIKLSATGKVQWSHVVDGRALFFLNANWINSLNPWQNGGCIVNMSDNNGTKNQYDDDFIQVFQLGPDGQVVRRDTFRNTDPYVYFNRHITNWNRDQYFVIKGDNTATLGVSFTNIRVETYSAQGQLLHTAPITQRFQASMYGDAYFALLQCVALPNGNYVVYLKTQSENVPLKYLFAQITPDGQVIWESELPLTNIYEFGLGTGKAFKDNSAGFTGSWRLQSAPPSEFHLLFLKIGPDGRIFPNNLSGLVARDLNGNCTAENTDQPLPSWLLQVQNTDTQQSWWTNSDAKGQYQTPAEAGPYRLRLQAPNYLWSICDNPVSTGIQAGAPNDVYNDFAVQATEMCPLMQVELSTPWLKAGQTSHYYLRYCNRGTAAATQATASVVLDPNLTLIGASAPYTRRNDTLLFDLGTVAVGDCGVIDLTAAVPAGTAAGTSVCVAARVTPDSICGMAAGPWTGAILDARGRCDADSVRFEIRNIGSGASSPNLDYIIADDHVVMYNGSLPSLAPGRALTISVNATGGSMRILADQEPNAPESESPSVPVEGCPAQSPQLTTGWVNHLPNQSGSPFSDLACRTVFGANEAVPQLIAFPSGIPPQNFIEAGTRITYLVQFTANTLSTSVVVIDTLNAELDWSTFEAGVSSHPYVWNMGANGLLYCSVDAALGPNESGFIEYSVRTKPDLAEGTVIRNYAGVAIGANASVTNRVFHTIRAKILGSRPANPTAPLSLTVSPNPGVDAGVVQLPAPAHQGLLVLRNLLGIEVLRQATAGSRAVIAAGHLPKGLYVVEYWEKGRVKGLGKWLVVGSGE